MSQATQIAPSFAAARQAPNAERPDTALCFALLSLILSVTVFQRFGLNFGSYSLNAALVGMVLVMAVATFRGALMLSSKRLLVYGLCLTVAISSFYVDVALAPTSRSSFASLLLLAAMYFPFIFVLGRAGRPTPEFSWALRAFSNVALFCALSGIVQFYAQFIIKADWLFDFGPYLPEALRGPAGYNTVISVGSLHKANGFFFREPSGFSFIMALGLIAECVSQRRMRRIACFGLALLLSYSGTGVLALFIGMLFPLGRKTLVRVTVLVCAGGLALLVLGDVLNLSFTLGRLAEFESERSSAYIRYIAPFRLIGETFGSEAWTPWLGHGPGAISREIRGYEFHDPTWAKLLFEYGLLGFLGYLGLFLMVLRQPGIPAQVRATLFFSWLIMGGHLLSPEHNFLSLALVGLWPSARTAPSRASTGVRGRATGLRLAT